MILALAPVFHHEYVRFESFNARSTSTVLQTLKSGVEIIVSNLTSLKSLIG